MKITTVGVFADHRKTEMVINELVVGGISHEEISCLYTNIKGDLKDTQSDKKVETGTVGGVTTGAVIGAIAGLAVANGIFPGIGTLFVAGPITALLGLTGVAATTVAGAATGAVAGGVLGALVQLGISDADAQIYEESLRSGNVVIITRTEQKTARDVMHKNGATEVREYIES